MVVELIINLNYVKFGQAPSNCTLDTILKGFAAASEKLVLVLGIYLSICS